MTLDQSVKQYNLIERLKYIKKKKNLKKFVMFDINDISQSVKQALLRKV